MKNYKNLNQIKLFRRIPFYFLLLSIVATSVSAETLKEVALEAQVAYNDAPFGAQISWKPPAAGLTSNIVTLRRRPWTTAPGLHADFTSLVSVAPATITSYLDTAIQSGTLYEYELTNTTSSNFRKAFIPVGKNIPWRGSRGGVLIVIDQTLASSLTAEMAQLKENLLLDGFQVTIFPTPRMAVDPAATGTAIGQQRLAEIQTVRAALYQWFNKNQVANRTVLLVGRVPIPYIGYVPHDGHSNHTGAWSTDVYYSKMLNAAKTDLPVWTDSRDTMVGIPSTIIIPDRTKNAPNDGKLDSTSFAQPELKVGRVDFSQLTYASEVTLLKRYFARNNQYRRRSGDYVSILPKVMIADNFGTYGGENFARTAWEGSAALFGQGATVESSILASTLPAPHFLSYACGDGTFTSIAGVGSSVNFSTVPIKSPFTALFGSYFGDWDTPDGVLATAIAGPAQSLALTTIWANRTEVDLTPLATGADIGTVALRKGYYNTSGSLLGDPTLRMQFFAPPPRVQVQKVGNTTLVNWDASTSPGIVGYHVFRQDTVDGPFTQISGVTASVAQPDGMAITGVTYTDTANVNLSTVRYAVAAIGRVVSGTVSYYDNSQATVGTVATGALPAPPTRLAIEQ